MITVSIALASICFMYQGQQECHNALVGPSTPRGEFPITKRLTQDAGYGGDVLQFFEDEKYVFAIHRVWTLRPSERREERLASNNTALRRNITNGCVNVTPAVYQKLLDCCINQKLVIE